MGYSNSNTCVNWVLELEIQFSLIFIVCVLFLIFILSL